VGSSPANENVRGTRRNLPYVSLVAEATTCIDTNDRLRADNGQLFPNPVR
jgi:hypothetical protein